MVPSVKPRTIVLSARVFFAPPAGNIGVKVMLPHSLVQTGLEKPLSHFGL